jgi:hypothetical protein
VKRKLFFTVFICLLIHTGYSQRFKGGFHIGLLATQVDRDEHDGYKKPGLFLGVFSNIPFREGKIKLQMELDYAQKGSRSPATHPVLYRITLHQIEIPLLFGWNFWKEFTLELGLSPNIIASAKEYQNNVLVAPNSGGSKFYLFELGGIAGAGYLFKEHYNLFFRFNYSISPVGRSVILREGNKLEGWMYNNALLFGFGYQF